MSSIGPVQPASAERKEPDISFGSITRGKVFKGKPAPDRIADSFNEALAAKIAKALAKVQAGKHAVTWGVKRAFKHHFEDVSHANRREALMLFASMPKDKGLTEVARILESTDKEGLNASTRNGTLITPEIYAAAKKAGSVKVAALLLADASVAEKAAIAPHLA